MPIILCTLYTKDGKPRKKKGFKFGRSGKCFEKREDALAQKKAIFSSGYRGK